MFKSKKRFFDTLFTTFLIVICAGIALAQDSESEEPEIRWIDGFSMEFEGNGWPEEAEQFARLPQRAEPLVSNTVWKLSSHTAGMALNFKTDSEVIKAKWSGGGAMVHMPATGVSGLDFYRRTINGEWKFIGVGKPKTDSTEANLIADMIEVEFEDSDKEKEYLIFLPLYQSVTEFEIGIDEGASFEVVEHKENPIVFYGTSIVQGGCASRTGMCHTGILRRWLDHEVINLGFSGSAKMEIEMADLISEIDAEAYVLDCLPNMTMELVETNLKPFLQRLSEKRPDTPIVLVEHPLQFADDRNAYLEETFDWLAEFHDAKISYIYREAFEGVENGTVDGIHMTDLGFLRMAQSMEAPLRSILED